MKLLIKLFLTKISFLCIVFNINIEGLASGAFVLAYYNNLSPPIIELEEPTLRTEDANDCKFIICRCAF